MTDVQNDTTIPLLNGINETTAETLVQRVKDELLPAISVAIKDEFSQIAAQFVTRAELHETTHRNQQQHQTDLLALKTELAHQQGQIAALRDQVQKTADGQQELRASVQAISANTTEIKAQHDNIAAEVKSAIATFQQGADLMMVTQQQMRVTIATQTEDRRRHDELAQRVTEAADDLHSKIRRAETLIDDTEKRYIESFLPLRDFVLGSETQPGLKKALETITGAISNLRAEIEPTRVWVQQRRNIERAALSFATSRVGVSLIGVVLAWGLNHLRLAALRGDLTETIPSLINFIFGG